MRSLEAGEPRPTKQVMVSLATGTQIMAMNEGGILPTTEQVDPILPIGKLSQYPGVKVKWKKGRCQVTHPLYGNLGVEQVSGRPMVSHEMALKLIKDLEAVIKDPVVKVLQTM